MGMPGGSGPARMDPRGDNSLRPFYLLLEAAFLTCSSHSFGVKVCASLHYFFFPMDSIIPPHCPSPSPGARSLSG